MATEFHFVGLSHNNTYYWHVNAINDKATSNWSETRNFTTNLETPLLVSPSDKEMNMPLNVKLVWNTSSGAELYRVQVAASDSFLKIINESANITGNIYIPDNLDYEQQYYWRILGFNATNESDWSAVSSFSTLKMTSVNDFGVQESEFTFSPVPATDYLDILPKNSFNFRIKLYNAIGEEVFTGENTDRIDLSSYPSGLLCYIVIYNNKFLTGRIIILK